MSSKKRRKVRYDRIAVIVIALVLVIALACGLFSCVTKTEHPSSKTDSSTVIQEEEKDITEVEGYQVLKDGGLSDEEIREMVSLDYYWPSRAERYANYTGADSIERRVLEVNCDLDEEPYTDSVIVDNDSDMTMLVNKSHALPEGYVPADLEVMESYACIIGEDYSCQDVDAIYLRSEALQAYYSWCAAAEEQGIHIRAIAGYRSYDYQAMLWNYGYETGGEEYADTYYARPGQSEHNSGLAVDITFNGYNFNEIENYEGYEWILSHACDYGFILRYPEDQQDMTRYGYESWHFRYVGTEAAKKIYENGWTLEEYHGRKAEE